jgi:hypothetical protein
MFSSTSGDGTGKIPKEGDDHNDIEGFRTAGKQTAHASNIEGEVIHN